MLKFNIKDWRHSVVFTVNFEHVANIALAFLMFILNKDIPRLVCAQEYADQINTARKTKFSIKDFFSKCDEILNGKLHFLCSEKPSFQQHFILLLY